METESLHHEPASPSVHVLARIMAAQTEMTAALPDSDAIMRLVTRYAMELSGATGASISVREGDNVFLPVNEGFTGKFEGTRFPISSTLSGQCLLTGEQFYVPDVDFLAPEASEIARASQVRTFLAVPLLHGEHIVAALSVASPQPYAFGPDEILVVHLLVRMAGSNLAHAQAFHALTEALADAKQAHTDAAAFAGMIANELHSSVAAIHHESDNLGAAGLGRHQVRAQELIVTEVRALRMLVGDLRAASALEREEFDLHRRVVSLDALLVEADDFAHTVAPTHPIHVQVGSGLDLCVDPGRIAQVLRNLLINAAKYTPPGTPIDIRSWRDGDRNQVWVAVVDHGPGIRPEDLDVIFAKFGRARHQFHQKIPGLGLGLYLSKRIVEAHGGELVVTSTLGQGASFAFSVPIAT